MKNHINTILLFLITVCLLKLAFWDGRYFSSFRDIETTVSNTKSPEHAEFKGDMQHVIVHNDFDNRRRYPLLVTCTNCR